MSVYAKHISITLSEELLKDLDRATSLYANDPMRASRRGPRSYRSEVVRLALQQWLKDYLERDRDNGSH